MIIISSEVFYSVVENVQFTDCSWWDTDLRKKSFFFFLLFVRDGMFYIVFVRVHLERTIIEFKVTEMKAARFYLTKNT